MKAHRESVKTALIIPDSHIPFESSNFDLMLKIARLVPIHEVVILGDFLDLYGLSFYDKNPDLGDVSGLYDREIECGNYRLDQIDLFSCKKIYLEGNHEYRLKKFLYKQAPALRNRIQIPDELNLRTRGKYLWVPYTSLQSYQIMDTNLYARHEPPAGGNMQNIAKQAGASVIYGHTHQFGIGTFVSKISGLTNYAINGGWLGNQKELVFDYVKGRPDWTQAFFFIHQTNKFWWPEPVLFSEKGAFFRGKFYK